MAKAKGMRKVAMTLMAHPDDAEFQVAGTLALLAKRGWEIHIVSASPGDCGTTSLSPDAIAAKRRQENTNAGKIIGAHYHCLELRDVYITYDHDAIRRALNMTRMIAPTLMFTQNLQDYMLDHEITAQLARTAAIGSFVPNAANGPVVLGAGVPHLYYADPAGGFDYYGDRPIATTYVDISSVIGVKERMLKSHASQRDWLFAHYKVDEYLRMMKEGSAARGADIGVKFAEGFRQHKGQGHPRDCILTQELGDLVVTRPAPGR